MIKQMESVTKYVSKDEELGRETENALKISENKSDSSICNKILKGVGSSEREIITEERAEDECFYDCTDSLENEQISTESNGDLKESTCVEKHMGKNSVELDGAKLAEQNVYEEDEEKLEEFKDDSDAGKLAGQQNIEEDEEYLKGLEKDMPEEEKQRRKKESEMLKKEGNDRFKETAYTEAETCYTEALRICPYCFQKERAILYSNRGAARMKQSREEEAIKDCSKAIELNPDYIRAILRRAELYEKTEKLDEALEDYKTVLEKDASVHQAREACMRLPRQIEERNERLKQEMMGKLKDLGNLLLKPFGLSTDNFHVNQDSASGSYSVNFVQNPNNNNR